MKKQRLYWICQVTGWGSYVLLTFLINRFEFREFDLQFMLNLLSTFLIGIGTSHLYRYFIIRNKWLEYKISHLIHRVILASVAFATLFYFIHVLVSEIIIAGRGVNLEISEIIQSVMNLTANYILWTLLYWLFHFIQNYRKEEIKNLKWEAAKNEIELNKIKSQLNPHFIFNSMNSIRALVDEHPNKAKDAITRLSNILRSSLLMGRKKLIHFDEEMALVRDYLDLEKIRLEDRLTVELDIDEDSRKFEVPPLMIQTLVENGIKHGVSRLKSGGRVVIKSKTDNDKIKITIINSGSFVNGKSNSVGFGLKNTSHRLKLIYGESGDFKIRNNDNGEVSAEITIPKMNEK